MLRRKPFEGVWLDLRDSCSSICYIDIGRISFSFDHLESKKVAERNIVFGCYGFDIFVVSKRPEKFPQSAFSRERVSVDTMLLEIIAESCSFLFYVRRNGFLTIKQYVFFESG